ncbi:hypothetical protein VNO78_10983 [Psophocarpus tetragonolobus]|uniref:Uncharacterized protein n=1 Tax=Psophocarpus tetragonolobus TaxID=3891 RepID=A0AAN9XN09_PSOTE
MVTTMTAPSRRLLPLSLCHKFDPKLGRVVYGEGWRVFLKEKSDFDSGFFGKAHNLKNWHQRQQVKKGITFEEAMKELLCSGFAMNLGFGKVEVKDKASKESKAPLIKVTTLRFWARAFYPTTNPLSSRPSFFSRLLRRRSRRSEALCSPC